MLNVEEERPNGLSWNAVMQRLKKRSDAAAN